MNKKINSDYSLSIFDILEICFKNVGKIILITLSIFLMPSSLIEINFVNYLTMFINKISLYTLGFIILNIFYQDLKNNLFKKESRT